MIYLMSSSPGRKSEGSAMALGERLAKKFVPFWAFRGECDVSRKL